MEGASSSANSSATADRRADRQWEIWWLTRAFGPAAIALLLGGIERIARRPGDVYLTSLDGIWAGAVVLTTGE
jgi:hypothetical protein